MNYQNNVKISIIIPSYNQGEFIERTLKSIIAQHYDNVEIIVMDGGSTDNSVDIIKRYEKHIYHWQSAKDNGQSAAINAGIDIATGEFVTWLNSDDVLLPGTLQAVNKCILQHPSTNWFLGSLFWIDKDDKIIKVGKSEKANKFWNSHQLFSNGGPTAFMRKSSFQNIGALRTDFDYMMDTELWHRFIKSRQPFVRINYYCWGLRIHENAKMSGHNFQNSALADKNHPSWIKKKKESNYIKLNYPQNNLLNFFWKLSKLYRTSFYTRFFDSKLLQQYYYNIKQD